MNFLVLIPEIIVCLTALAVIMADWFLAGPEDSRRNWLAYIAGLGLVVAFSTLLGWHLGGYSYSGTPQFYGSFFPDALAWFFRLALLFSGILTIMVSVQYVRDRIANAAEFYALLCLATLGGMLMTAATEFLTFYLALELLSISSFVLVGLKKDRIRASEASFKYLIFGALSSALLLYGVSMLLGLSGSISYMEISDFLFDMVKANPGMNLTVLLSILFILAGLGYKIAVVPFHMWAPDVYQGAPLPVTAFLSSSSKIAGFVALLRILEIFTAYTRIWVTILVLLAALSMTLGNLVALAQKDIKRLMAYSSIAHAGYLLLGVIATSEAFSRETAMTGLLYYMLAYILMSMGAFAVIIYFSKLVGSTQINAFAGLGYKAPWCALVLTCCLISLTGLPPFAGFTGKFYLFGAIINAGPQYIWLAVLGMLNSVVSLYYYSNIIKQLYFGKADDNLTIASPSPALAVVTGISLIGLLVLFVFPEPVIRFAVGLGSLL